MIVGIAVETTVVSKDARAVTRTSATVTARRRAGSKRGAGEADMPNPGRLPKSMVPTPLTGEKEEGQAIRRVNRERWAGVSPPRALLG